MSLRIIKPAQLLSYVPRNPRDNDVPQAEGYLRAVFPGAPVAVFEIHADGTTGLASQRAGVRTGLSLIVDVTGEMGVDYPRGKYVVDILYFHDADSKFAGTESKFVLRQRLGFGRKQLLEFVVRDAALHFAIYQLPWLDSDWSQTSYSRRRVDCGVG